MLAAAVVLLVSIATAHAAVQAELSATTIGAGQDVQLRLSYSGQTDAQPDLSPLARDFDVLASSRSSQFEIINGNTSSSTDLVLTLSPKHSGHLTVPSIRWGGEQSTPLSLDVSGGAPGQGGSGGSGGSGVPGSAGAGAAGGAPPTQAGGEVFLRTQVEPRQPYVQAAVHVNVSLYTAEPLYHPALSFAPAGNVLVQKLGADQQSTAVLSGRSYQVVTRHYVLFPQSSGALRVTGPVLDAQVAVQSNPMGNDPFARFFGNGGLFGSNPFGGLITATQPIRVHGSPIELRVRPRPAAATGSYWLPARNVELTSSWNPAPLRVKAGDPITVDLHLQAEGLTGAQLPDLSALWSLPPGLKVYPDQAKLQDSVHGDSIVGERDQTIALIANQPSRFTIPALPVHWWDTSSNSARVTTLPARTLLILPAVAPASASPSQALGSIAAHGSTAAAAPTPSSAATGTSGPAVGTSAARASGPTAPTAAIAPTAAAGAAGQIMSLARWRDIALSLAALWLVTIVVWIVSTLRRRRLSKRFRAAGGYDAALPGRGGARLRPDNGERTASPGRSGSTAGAPGVPTPAQARQTFVTACRRGDAVGARRALLAWAGSLSNASFSGLNALAARIGREDVAEKLRELDRACYLGEPWHGDALVDALAELREMLLPTPGTRQRRGLAPLYPN